VLGRFRRSKSKQGGPEDRPILAVDIDGVISLFGYDQAGDEHPGQLHLIDGMLHCISLPAAGRLKRLAKAYDLVWASGWEDRANDHLPQILGLPELPYLAFNGKARFGTAHWKLKPIERYSRGRALAWIDDSLDDSCYRWAEQRPEPTLLVPSESEIGLEEGHVEALLSWAKDLYTPR
jgi:hypothetical protein